MVDHADAIGNNFNKYVHLGIPHYTDDCTRIYCRDPQTTKTLQLLFVNSVATICKVNQMSELNTIRQLRRHLTKKARNPESPSPLYIRNAELANENPSRTLHPTKGYRVISNVASVCGMIVGNIKSGHQVSFEEMRRNVRLAMKK